MTREPSTRMDEGLLTMLLRGEHVSMEDRVKRGMWPYPQLRLGDLVHLLAKILERERWFPREWKPAVDGVVVNEGGVIEREGPGRYLYRAQRAHPIRPTVLAEQSERMFSSASDAARHYVRWDLGLPGNLDGYEVVE